MKILTIYPLLTVIFEARKHEINLINNKAIGWELGVRFNQIPDSRKRIVGYRPEMESDCLTLTTNNNLKTNQPYTTERHQTPIATVATIANFRWAFFRPSIHRSTDRQMRRSRLRAEKKKHIWFSTRRTQLTILFKNIVALARFLYFARRQPSSSLIFSGF